MRTGSIGSDPSAPDATPREPELPGRLSRSTPCPSRRRCSRIPLPPPRRAWNLLRQTCRRRFLLPTAVRREQAAARMPAVSSSGAAPNRALAVRVGCEAITSPNGLSGVGRRNPPVFHLRKLSCTRPSSGLRNISHGSHIERGMTLTSENSSWAAFGRSPPRIVITNRIISPRRSSPASASAIATMKESKGFDATTTLAPGTSFGIKSLPHLTKNSRSSSSCSLVNVVNRGNGDR